MTRVHTTSDNLTDSTYDGPSGSSWTIAGLYDPGQSGATGHQSNFGGGNVSSNIVSFGPPGDPYSLYVYDFGGEGIGFFNDGDGAESFWAQSWSGSAFRFCLRRDGSSVRLWVNGSEVLGGSTLGSYTMDIGSGNGLSVASNQAAGVADLAFGESAWTVAQCAAASSLTSPAYPVAALTGYGRAFETSAGTEYVTSSTGGVTETGGSYSAHTPVATPLDTLGSGPTALTPPLFSRSRTLFAPTLNVGAVALTPPAFTRSRSLFAPAVAAGATDLTPPALSRPRALFTPSLAVGAVDLSLPSFARSRSLFAPTVAAGALSLSPPVFTRSRSLFAPALALGAVDLTPSLVSRVRDLFAPSVAIGALSVSPPALTRPRSAFAPTLAVGDVSLSAPLFARSRSLFAPAVVAGGAIIQPPSVTRTRTLFAPGIAAGPVDLSPPSISRTRVIYTPDLGLVLALPLLTRSRSLFAPSVELGDIQIAPPLFTAARVIYVPSIAGGITALLPVVLFEARGDAEALLTGRSDSTPLFELRVDSEPTA